MAVDLKEIHERIKYPFENFYNKISFERMLAEPMSASIKFYLNNLPHEACVRELYNAIKIDKIFTVMYLVLVRGIDPNVSENPEVTSSAGTGSASATSAVNPQVTGVRPIHLATICKAYKAFMFLTSVATQGRLDILCMVKKPDVAPDPLKKPVVPLIKGTPAQFEEQTAYGIALNEQEPDQAILDILECTLLSCSPDSATFRSLESTQRAILRRQWECIIEREKAHIKLDKKFADDATLCHFAEKGRLLGFKALLYLGRAKPRQVYMRRQPIHYAVAANQFEIVKFLMQEYLMEANQNRYIPPSNILLEKITDMDHMSRPLNIVAVKLEKIRNIRTLLLSFLGNGNLMSVQSAPKEYSAPPLTAELKLSAETLIEKTKQSLGINKKVSLESLLCVFATRGLLEPCKALVSLGADPTKANAAKNPVFCAASRYHMDIVEFLVKTIDDQGALESVTGVLIESAKVVSDALVLTEEMHQLLEKPHSDALKEKERLNKEYLKRIDEDQERKKQEAAYKLATAERARQKEQLERDAQRLAAMKDVHSAAAAALGKSKVELLADYAKQDKLAEFEALAREIGFDIFSNENRMRPIHVAALHGSEKVLKCLIAVAQQKDKENSDMILAPNAAGKTALALAMPSVKGILEPAHRWALARAVELKKEAEKSAEKTAEMAWLAKGYRQISPKFEIGDAEPDDLAIETTGNSAVNGPQTAAAPSNK